MSNESLVTDFLNSGAAPIRTGIFNVADVGVMAGTAVLLFCLNKDRGVLCDVKTGDPI